MTFPFPAFCPGSAGALTAVTLVDTVTFSDTTSADISGLVQSGDAIIVLNTDYLTVEIAPTGYTELYLDVYDILPMAAGAYYKISNGSETSVTLPEPNSFNEGIVYIVRGNAPITTVTPAGWVKRESTGNPPSITLSTGSANTPLMAIACWVEQDGPINPRTFTPSADAEIIGDFAMFHKYKIYNSTPSNITVDMDDEGSLNVFFAGYVTFE